MPKLVGQMFVGIKFGVDGNNVALAVAVRTTDKKIFCEVIGCKPIRDGVDWMVDFIYRSGAKIVAVDGKSGTDILRDAMKEAKLKRPEVMTVQQVIKANALFDMAMEQGTFVHMHQSAVTQVVSNCERRKIGSNGGLGYASSLDGADIALLESMIIAHWICSETKAEKKKQKVSY
jgi:phage terminase large subunit-like protein